MVIGTGQFSRRTDLDQLVDWCQDATYTLDVATGAGHVAGALAETGVSRVVAADLSPEMVRTATTEYPRIEGVAVDAERLPFAADRFDAVTCRFAAHHFPDPCCLPSRRSNASSNRAASSRSRTSVSPERSRTGSVRESDRAAS